MAVGAALYYGLGAAGLTVHPVVVPEASFPLGFPQPSLGFITGLIWIAWKLFDLHVLN